MVIGYGYGFGDGNGDGYGDGYGYGKGNGGLLRMIANGESIIEISKYIN